ncbi:hypothetical protein ACFS4T_10830 [Pseudomonas lini]
MLLDSGRPSAERGRFDLLSAWPLEQLAVLPDESGSHFLQRLRDTLTRLGEATVPFDLPFAGGLIGYLSYDFGRHLEKPAESGTGRPAIARRTFWAIRLGPDQRSPFGHQPTGIPPDADRQ